MARNMYGATSADFTLTAGGRVVPGATLTVWSARTGGTQVTDLLDATSVACTTVTSGADGSVVFYGPNNEKSTLWLDSGQGSRIAVRPVDITGETGATPALTIGTVTTGTAGATITGTDEDPVLNLVLPSAGANGVNTAAIQDDAVTSAKIAADAVGSSEIAAGAVGTSELADASVTAAKLSIPVFVGSGTSSPEGAVTATPQQRYLQTSGAATATGAMEWVKATGTGNTGWQAGAEADTGWRDITATVEAAYLLLEPDFKLYVRRIGALVEWIYADDTRGGYTAGTATGTQIILDSVPTGLRTVQFNASIYSDTFARLVDSNGALTGESLSNYNSGKLYAFGLVSGKQRRCRFTHGTNPAVWLSSLPGSAA